MFSWFVWNPCWEILKQSFCIVMFVMLSLPIQECGSALIWLFTKATFTCTFLLTIYSLTPALFKKNTLKTCLVVPAKFCIGSFSSKLQCFSVKQLPSFGVAVRSVALQQFDTERRKGNKSSSGARLTIELSMELKELDKGNRRILVT